MSEAKHTSGPWGVVRTITGDRILTGKNPGNGRPLAWVECSAYTLAQVGGKTTAEAIANAELIAAAPDPADVVRRVMYDINGRNATLRATDRDYAASPMCAALNDLVRAAAAALEKAGVTP
jgi:hypothetical protein